MIKRVFSSILSLIMIFSAFSYVYAEDEFIKVRLNTYTKQSGTKKMDGLYKDNTLYVSADVLADVSSNSIKKDTASEVVLSFASGYREMKITSNGKATEQIHKLKYTFDLPVAVFEGKLYFSLPHVLRYQGAKVEFGDDEKSPTHLMITEPYTIYELVSEYNKKGGYAFSWAEAEGKLVDPEKIRYLAALDTLFVGYDPNLFHYIFAGEKIHTDFCEDVVTEVLNSLTADTKKDEEKISKAFHNGSAGMVVTMDFVSEAFQGLPKSLYSFTDDMLYGAGTFLKITDKFVSVLEAGKLYGLLDDSLGSLLKNSISRVDKTNPRYEETDVLLNAADNVSEYILDDGALNKKLKWDTVYNNLTIAADTLLNFGYPSIIYEGATAALANDEFVNDEIKITFADECNNLRIIASDILTSDYKTVLSKNWYGNKSQPEIYVEYLKSDVLMALASAYASRNLLLETGWLTDNAQSLMQSKADKTRELIAKGVKAEAVVMARKPSVTENIEWIQYLKIGSGLDFGNFADVGNDPNNLWHSEDCLAFDSEYIYYKGGRITYDGKKDTTVAPQGKFLNCYNGYVYYAIDGSASNPYARVMRINCDTGEEEQIFEITGKDFRNDYEIESMYLAGGYAFFCLTDDEFKNAKTYIYALDVETLEYRIVYSEFNEYGVRPAHFSSDNMRNVYAFMKIDGSNSVERKTLKINLDDMNSDIYARMTQDDEEPQIKSGAFAQVVLAPNGLLKMSSKYYEDYYGAIESEGSNSYDELDTESDTKYVVGARNQRYILDGNHMVVFVTDGVYVSSDFAGDLNESAPVYICENFDYNSPVFIDRVKNINLFSNDDNKIGVYNNCVYVIEETETEFNLITIESDGTFTRIPIH